MAQVSFGNRVMVPESFPGHAKFLEMRFFGRYPDMVLPAILYRIFEIGLQRYYKVQKPNPIDLIIDGLSKKAALGALLKQVKKHMSDGDPKRESLIYLLKGCAKYLGKFEPSDPESMKNLCQVWKITVESTSIRIFSYRNPLGIIEIDITEYQGNVFLLYRNFTLDSFIDFSCGHFGVKYVYFQQMQRKSGSLALSESEFAQFEIPCLKCSENVGNEVFQYCVSGSPQKRLYEQRDQCAVCKSQSGKIEANICRTHFLCRNCVVKNFCTCEFTFSPCCFTVMKLEVLCEILRNAEQEMLLQPFLLKLGHYKRVQYFNECKFNSCSVCEVRECLHYVGNLFCSEHLIEKMPFLIVASKPKPQRNRSALPTSKLLLDKRSKLANPKGQVQQGQPVFQYPQPWQPQVTAEDADQPRTPKSTFGPSKPSIRSKAVIEEIKGNEVSMKSKNFLHFSKPEGENIQKPLEIAGYGVINLRLGKYAVSDNPPSSSNDRNQQAPIAGTILGSQSQQQLKDMMKPESGALAEHEIINRKLFRPASAQVKSSSLCKVCRCPISAPTINIQCCCECEACTVISVLAKQLSNCKWCNRQFLDNFGVEIANHFSICHSCGIPVAITHFLQQWKICFSCILKKNDRYVCACSCKLVLEKSRMQAFFNTPRQEMPTACCNVNPSELKHHTLPCSHQVCIRHYSILKRCRICHYTLLKPMKF